MSYSAGHTAALRLHARTETRTNPVFRLVARLRAWNKCRHDAEHLRELPDYLLSDIGIVYRDVNSAFLSKPRRFNMDRV